MNEAVLILGMVAVTFGVRYASLALVGQMTLSDNVVRILRYVPVAVLTAITVPEMVYRDGAISMSYTNPYLVAGVASIAISYWMRNQLLTIALGLVIFFAYRFLLGV